MAGLRNRIREFRKLRKMTQRDLAEAVGVTKNTISCFELQQFQPRVEVIFALGQALGVEHLEDLFVVGECMANTACPYKQLEFEWKEEEAVK